MKKAIVASILGLAASGIAAFGQGNVNFNNYSSTTYATDQVLWGANSGHTAGTPVGSASVEVQLFYELGTISGTAANFASTATAGITGFISTTANAGGHYGVGPYGYFAAGNQIINGWSSGPVTFMYEAWDTTTGASFAAATVEGYSALWQETGSATASSNGIEPTSLPPQFFADSPGVTLTGVVPEPTTLAFAGMGLLSLLAIARRKNV